MHHGGVGVAALVSCLLEQRISVGFRDAVMHLCCGDQRFGIGVGWLVSALLLLFA
jgi:hypothetical protein